MNRSGRSPTSSTAFSTADLSTVGRSRGSLAAFSASRDAKGAGATLTLFAQCRGMYGPDSAKGSDYDECAEKILKVQNGYVAFLRAHASSQ